MFNKLLWTMAGILLGSAVAQADLVAYNDFGGTSGANVTTYILSQSGLLKNYTTGANTTITLNVVTGSPPPANDSTTGTTPTAGDAYTIFNGIVNLAGFITYNTTPPFTSVRLDFTGLDPNKTYDLVLTANRDNPAYSGSAARYTQFTISDVSTFTNSHSNGTTLLTVTQANDSVKVEVGYNTLKGYVARWTGITSGTDGDMSVNVTAPPATGGAGDGKWYLGGLRLIEAGQKVLAVNHQPYLQLGNAPLSNTGPGIGTTDQMVIAWQTVEASAGGAPNDYFEAEYRLAGGGSWTAVSPVSTLNTGVTTRVNRWVTITGLSYNTNYEYRVHHKRNPSSPILVITYSGTFTTRRSSADVNPFTMAAFGDAAKVGDNAGYESVMNRLTTVNPALVALLGDNIYDNGTHAELDAIFDANFGPISSAFIRNHIHYFCMGNHEAGTSSGQPSLDDFFCPIPVLGVTSPVSPPSGETAEKNYSFDYGLVHFAVIDSTAWGGPGELASRQSAILNWLSADLTATTQPWKIVIAHHPPKTYFGHTDTGEGMAAELVPVLVQKGVSLLLVGHSHNYQRSFPITGYSGTNVTWIADSDGSYDKAGQVIEIVAGTGGRPIDGGAPTSAVDWLAKALGSNNGGEFGPLVIDVSRSELKAKWTAADDGAVKDQIYIIDPFVPRKVDLGSPDVADGLTHSICCDGNTTPWAIGGRTARVNTNAAVDHYFYFNVSDGYALNGNKPSQTITVDYFDKDTGTLTLQYDGTASAYVTGPSVTLTNTLTWKTATWQVSDAYFGNRQNGGADFRVYYSGADFYLDIITVAPATQAPYGGTARNIPGTIQAEDFDTGGEGVAYHDTTPANQGGQYRAEGVDIETTTDTGGGYGVGYINAGEWLEYTVNVASTGDYTFKVRLSSCCAGGTFTLKMNNNTIASAKSFATTGGWQNWTTIMVPAVFLTAGNNQIFQILFDNGNLNCNKIDVGYGGADAVHVDLATTVLNDGMTHPQVADGDTAGATIGGHNCRINVNNANDFYMYFAVFDSYAFQGNRPNLWISFDYYDTGTGTLQLQYDANSSPYMSGPSVTLVNSNTWKSVAWNVTDAYFGNRQNNGSDYRIFRGTGITFYLDTVQTSLAQP